MLSLYEHKKESSGSQEWHIVFSTEQNSRVEQRIDAFSLQVLGFRDSFWIIHQNMYLRRPSLFHSCVNCFVNMKISNNPLVQKKIVTY